MPDVSINHTAEDEIVDTEDFRAVEELQQSESRRETSLHESTRDDRIKTILTSIQDAGYATPFDFMLEFLEYTPQAELRRVRDGFHGEGMRSLFEAWTSNREFRSSDKLNTTALRITETHLKKEMHELHKSLSVLRPMSRLGIGQVCDFSLDQFRCELRRVAPTLFSLFETLALPVRRQTTTPDTDRPESDDGSVPPLESIASVTETRSSGPRSRRRLAVFMSMSILLYAQSQRCNLVQRVLGYFLHASRTPKRVVDSLHRLGVCTSYESVINAMKSVASGSAVEFQKVASE